MLMGQEDQVGLGEGIIIGQIAVGIHMDHLSPEVEHQRTMADEGGFNSPAHVLMISVSNFSWARAEATMITVSRLLNNNNVFITHLLWNLKIFETPQLL